MVVLSSDLNRKMNSQLMVTVERSKHILSCIWKEVSTFLNIILCLVLEQISEACSLVSFLKFDLLREENINFRCEGFYTSGFVSIVPATIFFVRMNRWQIKKNI